MEVFCKGHLLAVTYFTDDRPVPPLVRLVFLHTRTLVDGGLSYTA